MLKIAFSFDRFNWPSCDNLCFFVFFYFKISSRNSFLQMGKDTEKIWLKIKAALLKDSGAYSVSISNGVDIMESSCNVTIERMSIKNEPLAT